MARGNVAKDWVTKKIIEAFGQDNTILYDKKIYINTTEDGAPIQVALTLTCPKNMVGIEQPAQTPSAPSFGGLDFENMGAPVTKAPEATAPAEITEKERDTIQELMRRLGL